MEELATEEYMSTHSLTFSTPEMTLKKFALWLGDQVTLKGNNDQVPRLMVFLKELNDDKSDKTEFMPDIDDSFKPSGAVTEMYGKGSQNTRNALPAVTTGNHFQIMYPMHSSPENRLKILS